MRTDSVLSRMVLLSRIAVFAFIIIVSAGVFFDEASASGYIKVGSAAKDASQTAAPEISIANENVTVAISNQMVKTRVVQVFKNNTGRILEGEYIFPLPFGANIVSFATWDDGVKINGIILEKVKAKKIYEDIVSKLKDPGLLENIGSNTFHAKIFPVPAYGTKRLELEYVEYLPLQNGLYSFVYPLHSEDFAINPREISINVELKSDFEIASPQIFFKNVSFARLSDNNYSASFASNGFNDGVDFKLSYFLKMQRQAPKMIFYNEDKNGEAFFLATFRPADIESAKSTSEVSVKKAIFLIDSSYTMRGEKLEIVKKLFSNLKGLENHSHFNAIFFDSRARRMSQEMMEASEENIARLVSKISKTRPFGDSRPIAALNEAKEIVREDKGASGFTFIIITDGIFSTIGETEPFEKSLNEFRSELSAISDKISISALGVGSDCKNDSLQIISNMFSGEFRSLASINDEQTSLSTASVLKAMSGGIVDGVNFSVNPADSVILYPDAPVNVNFDSECYAVGKALKTGAITLDVSYEWNRAKKNIKIVSNPSEKSVAWYIPLLWARKRADFLTMQIEHYGENDKMKKEIVELSKKYNFVTKFTSFLAVPPSVLRPRRIKPGDPEICVNAPSDSKLVVIRLPFSEPIKAAYDEAKGAFVARFTAPAHVKDAKYEARIIVVDKFNRETHSMAEFFIDSTPPVIYASCSPARALRSSAVMIKVNASNDTASIKAKIFDGSLIDIKYDPLAKLSIGSFTIAQNHPLGKFKIEVEAIDHAGNRGVKYIDYEVSGEIAGADSKTNIKTAGDNNERM